MSKEIVREVTRKFLESRRRWVYSATLDNGAQVMLRTSTRKYQFAVEYDDTISRANNPAGSTAARFCFTNYIRQAAGDRGETIYDIKDREEVRQ